MILGLTIKHRRVWKLFLGSHTFFIGSKNRGKEGISKTGSRMSRKIHVSSMTVDTTIRIVLHSVEVVPFTHTTQSRLDATSRRWRSTLFCIPAGILRRGLSLDSPLL